MKELTMASLFAGIGGFELSATWAGIKPIWSNEIDPWCCKVLRKNFNHEIIEKDIRQIGSNSTNSRVKNLRERENETNDKKRNIELRPIDILTGGFPCQPFSHAGKRKGKDDNRYLWPEYLRLIRELQPSWIIAENVAGLISMENGKTLEGILIDLENENYQTEVYNIPACGVGAWHKRERIWILCHKRQIDTHISESRQLQHSELPKGQQYREGRESFGESSALHQDVSNSCGQGLQGTTQGKFKGIQSQAKPFPGSELSRANAKRWEYRDSEPGMGDMVNGLPSRMVGYWDREPDIPRVEKGTKDRVNKLKGLGNAIVPYVSYEFYKAIVDYENLIK